MKRKLVLNRLIENERQILGELKAYNESGVLLGVFKTLELPWLGNRRKVSCIPLGVYDIKRGISGKNGNVYNVLGVPDRIGIQIHVGNFYTQIEGCILVGHLHKDINKDGLLDVTDSRRAMNELYNLDFETLEVNGI